MSSIQCWPAMPPGRCSLSHCNSTHPDCNSCHSQSFLHLRAASRETRQNLTVRSTADSAAPDARRSAPAETTRGPYPSQYSRRPVRTPKSEDPQQLPAHRRLRVQITPAKARPELVQRAPRYGSPEARQMGSKAAAGSHEMQNRQHSSSAAPAAKEHVDSALSHTRDTMQIPGHPQLQPYWSDLESGTLQGESEARLLMRVLCKAAYFLVVTR